MSSSRWPSRRPVLTSTVGAMTPGLAPRGPGGAREAPMRIGRVALLLLVVSGCGAPDRPAATAHDDVDDGAGRSGVGPSAHRHGARDDAPDAGGGAGVGAQGVVRGSRRRRGGGGAGGRVQLGVQAGGLGDRDAADDRHHAEARAQHPDGGGGAAVVRERRPASARVDRLPVQERAPATGRTSRSAGKPIRTGRASRCRRARTSSSSSVRSRRRHRSPADASSAGSCCVRQCSVPRPQHEVDGVDADHAARSGKQLGQDAERARGRAGR